MVQSIDAGFDIALSTLNMLNFPPMPHRFPRTQAVLPATADWISGLSVERYRPMLRLLDDSDLEFLCRQPGFDRRVAGRLRRQRCRIFRGYLNSLADEFRKMCGTLRVLMVHSAVDRPDLALALTRKQSEFRLCMLRARWRLLLFQWGSGCVDIAGLMNLFDNLCGELQGMVPRPGVNQSF
jgi:hypothetical protein